MTQVGRTRRRWWGSKPAAVVALGLVLSAVATWQTSAALFSANTTNGGQSFSTGSVALSDNDLGVALFNVTNMKPGSTGQQCIKLTYSGSLASAVKVYGQSLTATNSLDQWLNVQIEEGSTSATTFPNCTGFAASGTIFNNTLNTLGTSYATGVGTWAPPGGASVSKDYRITYTLLAAAPNSTQNSSASVTFTWEAQNT